MFQLSMRCLLGFCVFLLIACQNKNEKCADCDSEMARLEKVYREEPAYYSDALEDVARCAKQKNCNQAFFVYAHYKCNDANNENKRDSALYWGNEALRIATSYNDRKDIAWAKTKLGQVYTDKQDYATALKIYHEALQDYEQINDTFRIAILHYEIGWLQTDIGLLHEALLSNRNAVKYIRLTDRWHYRNVFESTLSSIYEKNKDYQKSLIYQDSALYALKKSGTKAELIQAELRYCHLLSRLKRPVSLDSISHLADAFDKNATPDNDPFAYGAGLQDIANLYNSANQQDKAASYLNKALAIYKNYDNTLETQKCHLQLGKYYETKKDYQKAYTFLSIYADSLEIHQSEENRLQITKLNSFYETEKKESQIELLKSEQKNNRLWVWFFAAIAAVALLAVFFIQQRLRLSKTLIKKNELDLDNQRLANQNLQLEQSQIKTNLEKERLEKELIAEELAGKSRELTTFTLQMAQRNDFLIQLKEGINATLQQSESIGQKLGKLNNLIDQNLDSEQNWTAFKLYFEQVHPNFLKRINEQYTDLTAADLRLIALLRLNVSTKEIASLLSISPASANSARYRIRKRLGLEEHEDLISFINKL
jgi:DNA-binding CsgD family transcriptional regulator/tetratricopeptide (TPR) repeat protein